MWHVTAQERCYVADSINNGSYSSVYREGTISYARKFEKKGSGNGELSWPVSISVDSEDVVYVAKDDNYCVSVFMCGCKFLLSFVMRESGPGQLAQPRGIAVDMKGVVYVSVHCKITPNLFRKVQVTQDN